MENSSRDGNTRPIDLPADKSVSVRTGHGTKYWFQRKLLHNKGNYKQGGKTAFGMGENNSK